MAEQVVPGLYKIEVPLPNNPLKALNSYVIRAGERSLVIDTGMNRRECREALVPGLESLGVNLERTDFFITHLHTDHMGLAGLAPPSSRIFFNTVEVPMVDTPDPSRQAHWKDFHNLYLGHGFPEAELIEAGARHPGRRFGPGRILNFTAVNDGDSINIGDFHFRCVSTPGHSPGHTCLYEADRQLLIAGDHILFDITPNITVWTLMMDSLSQYLRSLDKVYTLDIKLTLPGHRSSMPDHRRRIRELKAHHQARAREAIAALREGDKNAWEVAPHITWDIACDSWETFPSQQKWFAFGETLAHLIYLEEHGKVRQKQSENGIVFSAI